MGELVRPERVTTVRVPAELGDDVDMVARIDETTFSEVVRAALTAYVQQRAADDVFRNRVAQRIAADQRILDRLASEPVDGGGS